MTKLDFCAIGNAPSFLEVEQSLVQVDLFLDFLQLVLFLALGSLKHVFVLGLVLLLLGGVRIAVHLINISGSGQSLLHLSKIVIILFERDKIHFGCYLKHEIP